ncbi:MAG: hypothetical protein J6Y89_03960 [Lachnospiraceae bacterium]|nr:hypothetical protein [Lachnospiraceae bacterium]
MESNDTYTITPIFAPVVTAKVTATTATGSAIATVRIDPLNGTSYENGLFTRLDISGDSRTQYGDIMNDINVLDFSSFTTASPVGGIELEELIALIAADYVDNYWQVCEVIISSSIASIKTALEADDRMEYRKVVIK